MSKSGPSEAEENIDGIEDGTISTGSSDSAAADVGESGDAQGTFFGGGGGGAYIKLSLMGNGNLVILLPASMQGDVTSAQLLDNSGNTVEIGYSHGPYEDGRPLFRFNDTGVVYPDSMTVQVRLASGDVKEYTIPDSEKRLGIILRESNCTW